MELGDTDGAVDVGDVEDGNVAGGGCGGVGLVMDVGAGMDVEAGFGMGFGVPSTKSGLGVGGSVCMGGVSSQLHASVSMLAQSTFAGLRMRCCTTFLFLVLSSCEQSQVPHVSQALRTHE